MYRLELLVKGSKKEVYALIKDERCEVIDFIKTLPDRACRRINAVLQRMAETGWAGHREEMVKHLTENIYEIKEHSTNSRLFCFFHGPKMIVCTHCRKKPAGKRRYNEEIKKVKSLYQSCKEAGILND